MQSITFISGNEYWGKYGLKHNYNYINHDVFFNFFFKTRSENSYTVLFYLVQNNKYSISFCLEEEYKKYIEYLKSDCEIGETEFFNNLTKLNESHEVFSQIIKIIKLFIKNYKPKTLLFFSPSDRKINVYKKLYKKYFLSDGIKYHGVKNESYKYKIKKKY